MKKYLFIVILASLALASCGHKEKVEKPRHFLSEQQMIDVLADSYLIEAELNQMKTEGKDVGALQRSFYEQLFDHYGITDSIFKENMNYYSYHLVEMERIMDSVMNRFLKAQGQ